MEQEEFAELVRKEIDEEINPFYVAEILKKDIPDLLRWLQESNFGALAQVAQETVFHAEAYEARESKERRRTLHLGLRMLEGRCKLGLFILKEIKRRLETVDASFERAAELPAGEDKTKK